MVTKAAWIVAWLARPLAGSVGALTGICEGIITTVLHENGQSARRRVRANLYCLQLSRYLACCLGLPTALVQTELLSLHIQDGAVYWCAGHPRVYRQGRPFQCSR